MKFNILRLSFLAVVGAMFFSATSCVKDKGFDNNEYGIKNPGTPMGVLFQQSKLTADNTVVPVITGIVGVSTSQSLQTLVKLAANGPAAKDVHVKIALNNDLVDPTGLTVLDAAYYTVPSWDVVIPAGEKNVYFVLNIPDASIIDPSVVYGLGFTITEVQESDYTIASNSKSVVLGIAIKNQWDGTYQSTGYVYHPSVPRAFEEEKDLATVSSTSVSCWWGDLGSAGYVALLTIDPISNKVAISDYSTGIPIVGMDDGLPTSNPGYTPKWDGSPLCNNTYDPATKTFYLRMAYLGSTGYRVDEEILVRE